MSLSHCLVYWTLAALAAGAALPKTDEGRIFMFNDRSEWDGGFENLGRGGRGLGGGMMLSGWGPEGMTAFTSTGGGEVAPPPGQGGPSLSEGGDIQGEERSIGNYPNQPSANRNNGSPFNAWFPIVFGSTNGGQQGEGGQRGGGWPPVAAIANSISHGNGGRATSHAVAYGGGGQHHNGGGGQHQNGGYGQQQPQQPQQPQQRRRH